jgi:hypothetical protein
MCDFAKKVNKLLEDITVCSNFIHSCLQWLQTIIVQWFCFEIVSYCPPATLTVWLSSMLSMCSVYCPFQHPQFCRFI